MMESFSAFPPMQGISMHSHSSFKRGCWCWNIGGCGIMCYWPFVDCCGSHGHSSILVVGPMDISEPSLSLSILEVGAHGQSMVVVGAHCVLWGCEERGSDMWHRVCHVTQLGCVESTGLNFFAPLILDTSSSTSSTGQGWAISPFGECDVVCISSIAGMSFHLTLPLFPRGCWD